MIATLAARGVWLRRVAITCGVVGVAAASGLAGVTFAAVGLRFGLVPALVLAGVGIALWAGTAVAVSRPDLALLLVPLTLPLGTRTVPGLPLRVVEMSMFAAVGLAAAGRALHGRPAFAWPAPLLWAVGLVAWLALAVPVATDIATALHQVVLVGFGILLAASIAACDREDDVRWLTVAFVALGAATCALSLRTFRDLSSQFGGGLVENRVQGPFAQPNDLGTLADLVLFVSLGCLLAARRTLSQIASAIFALSALGALVLSLSRGAWIGAALGAGALLAVLPGGRRRLVVLGLIVVVSILGLATLEQQQATSVVTDRFGKLFDRAGNPYDTRPQIYSEALHLVETHPLFGVGPGGFYDATLTPDAVAGSSALHAHNVLLTVAAEAGLPAAALIIGFTLMLALASLRAIRAHGPPGQRRLLTALACALLAVVGQGLVDFTLRNPVLLTLVWFVVGLVLAWIPRCEIDSADALDVERRSLEIAAVER